MPPETYFMKQSDMFKFPIFLSLGVFTFLIIGGKLFSINIIVLIFQALPRRVAIMQFREFYAVKNSLSLT